MKGLRSRAAVLVTVTGVMLSHAAADAPAYDPADALRVSQHAVGNQLGNYPFFDPDGNQVRLTDYAGKPLLVSLVFTSCYHTCPVTTRHLDRAVAAARDALGGDSFQVVTIGFDSARDTPEAMRNFAREQRVLQDGWHFLSGPADSTARLQQDLGFVSFPSARGFDHLVQLSIVDGDSRVYAQAYGESFELPWLVEPLKELVFARPRTAPRSLDGLLARIRLFCTVYDPASGRYRFDYSLFIQMAVGLVIVLSVSTYLVREVRRARRLR